MPIRVLNRAHCCSLGAVATLLFSVQVVAQELDPATKLQTDELVTRIMKRTGVPSLQFGIVRGDKVVYTVARGESRIGIGDSPAVAATPQMHYPIGSISKQFTVACILLLQERGKLNLDDPVSKWFPELTRASEITIRMLLTHTSGYRDFAPQDYALPEWLQAGHPLDIVHHWAELPLDFDPMTKMQYSNTNYVLAGLIVEKGSGEPFRRFLQENVIQPLKLEGVLDLDYDRADIEPIGYRRNALGPLRPALAEAPGWYTGAGTLAMPVATLLQWDLSLMSKSLLRPVSYDAMEKEQRLKDGGATNGGLGLQVGRANGHLIHLHSGEVAGFSAVNLVMPEDHVAIAVLINQDANNTAMEIAQGLVPLLVPSFSAKAPAPAPSPTTQLAKELFLAFQNGKIDRSRFTENANFYFSQQVLDDYRDSLKPMGAPLTFMEVHSELRGGMQGRTYQVKFQSNEISISTYWKQDGKLEQFLVEPE
jgi:CubicO group peptidase (beta-lactamase class C family)